MVAMFESAVAHSAELFLVQTKDIRSGLVVFDVMLDPEGEAINAFSGTLSFPGDIASVELIDTVSSVAPLWVTRPKESSNTFSDGKIEANIFFEGVVPGGFDGIRSPYYEGKRAGKIFTLVLRPKAQGEGILAFKDSLVLRNDGKATPAFVTTRIATITIPDLKTLPNVPKVKLTGSQKEYEEAKEKTLDAYIVKDDALAEGRFVVLIEDDTSRHTIVGYRVAESKSAITRDVPFFEWKDASSPFILSFQKRDRFIHVQSMYADGTRTTKIIPPVENTSDELTLWRILIGIAIGIFVVYVLQKRHALQSILRHPKNNP